MAQHGFNITSKVADCIVDGNWNWPEAWRDLYPVLFQLQNITLNETNQDRIMWQKIDGNIVDFSTKEVWEAMRVRGQPVGWAKTVWSALNIPKHAFVTWLIFKKKLWTQDRILHWNRTVTGSMNLMCCLLCYSGIDTHNHLFFECEYSKAVWYSIRNKGDMGSVSEKWEDVVNWLVPRSASRSIASVISRILVAASAYFIWRERNARFFNNRLRPPELISELIVDTVRAKLLSFKYKRSARVITLMEEWKLDGVERFGED
ncbi:uncharacterized protein LOC110924561 [Helianthus annuus]|uniref:uncharacterized protein LOC110924561 n=1 Tax=Helianthus annuus TaxID=4232 RepID=UPI000B9073E4|nr:uncharacterized protein LOC110924561 [Helianthus annuus]